MVTPARTETSADRVRPLNQPRPIEVALDAQTGLPLALHDRRGRHTIARVQDSWRVDDEWWRDPISRQYVQVLLTNGAVRTLYHDLIADRWFEQAY
jgi:hypothetical protein